MTACVAADGFDVFSIALAAPKIASAWGIDDAELGVVMSMDLIGMGVGAVVIGALADRLGRMRLLITSLVIVAIGMAAASICSDVPSLSIVRLLTGLGIGGLLTTGNSVIGQDASGRPRGLDIAIMISGFSLGAVLGAAASAGLQLVTDRWQAIFELGALATALLILPAAVLSRRRDEGTTAGFRNPLTRPAALQLFNPNTRRTTALLALAYIGQTFTFYFLMKWIPTLAENLGHSHAASAALLGSANIGGAAGAIVFGLVASRFALRPVVAASMVIAALLMAAMGFAAPSYSSLSFVVVVVAFFIVAGNAGLYALAAEGFPCALVGSGTGLVVGCGRLGAAAGPITGGVLLSAGWPLSWVTPAMACGCLAAALTISLLPRVDWQNESGGGIRHGLAGPGSQNSAGLAVETPARGA
ncbi:MFS transporter [Acuticoccus sediminis]|uniref:MFS transporter n=1 Tax=Acuticoccus sediminis TaxID=2184697 RepID=UPI001391BDFF|nr:MFS transporter [Acuticoccus sediminis]